MNFHDRLEQLRTEREMTMEQLALRSGLSQSTLWHFTTRSTSRQPNLYTLARLAMAFDMETISELVDGILPEDVGPANYYVR